MSSVWLNKGQLSNNVASSQNIWVHYKSTLKAKQNYVKHQQSKKSCFLFSSHTMKHNGSVIITGVHSFRRSSLMLKFKKRILVIFLIIFCLSNSLVMNGFLKWALSLEQLLAKCLIKTYKTYNVPAVFSCLNHSLYALNQKTAQEFHLKMQSLRNQ